MTGPIEMFVPHMYREPDADWVVELMVRNPLALLITNGSESDGPYATHLPVILDPAMGDDRPADLVGATLFGHMNRANPQWRSLRSGMPVVLSFSGPHAYVSPCVYRTTPAAPTWNFAAVQVRGVLHEIESGAATLQVVTATVRALEAEFGDNWNMSDSLDYFREILPGVGAFRIAVTDARGMFKMSQEQDVEIQDRVWRHFASSESTRHRETAEYMKRISRNHR
ncbi:FMN-binding negative transcriptional regulator [Nocardia sp. NPDC050793]|uniref:FMN-binding negative transcriptional regulator n=1 Tax=Nocardia sp. NPDC050793 TaxID=3155159 RepID=UPI0033DE1490